MAYRRAARKDEVPAGTIREFQVDGQTLAISNVEGKFYAIDNTCLHRGGPLGQGELKGKIVTCPWHSWQYDVTTGKVVSGPKIPLMHPKIKDEPMYAVKVEGKDILLESP